LLFLKPGQYLHASDNRFVILKDEEPCLVLENDQGANSGRNEARYIVLAKNEQLIAISNNFVSTGETK
tara:strand:+ start:2683 stop:2886 length:204 start_codon:yes stop_codon:yes gene_type:complete